MIGPRLLDLLGLDIPSKPAATEKTVVNRAYGRAEMREWFPASSKVFDGPEAQSKCSAARRHVMDAARTKAQPAGPSSIDDPLASKLPRG